MIDEEVTAAVLAIIAVAAVFAGSQFLYAGGVTEPFSELAVLGPNMKVGDYPKGLMTDENFTLYLYVRNYESHTCYYQVLVKLGNKATQISNEGPMDVESVARYEVILPHGGSGTRLVNLSTAEPGINKRLVFELWIYKTDIHEFEYNGRWCQLWLNITAPT